MTSIEEADTWIGRTAVDDRGEQIGMITQIWVDDDSGQAEWASVRIIGRKGHEALVPLAGAVVLGGGRQFAYSMEAIVDAPQVAQDGRLSVEDKELIASYYGNGGAGPATAPPSPSWMNLDSAPEPPVPPWMAVDGAPQPPAGRAVKAPKAAGRFRRKPASSDKSDKSDKSDRKATRRFGRKSTAPDQDAGFVPMHPDEVPAGR